MAAQELAGYLTRGAIINSVNGTARPGLYPRRAAVRAARQRAQHGGLVTALLAAQGINIANMVNKSRGALAYTVIDADGEIGANGC